MITSFQLDSFVRSIEHAHAQHCTVFHLRFDAPLSGTRRDFRQLALVFGTNRLEKHKMDRHCPLFLRLRSQSKAPTKRPGDARRSCFVSVEKTMRIPLGFQEILLLDRDRYYLTGEHTTTTWCLKRSSGSG
jgi:hypothetical protein